MLRPHIEAPRRKRLHSKLRCFPEHLAKFRLRGCLPHYLGRSQVCHYGGAVIKSGPIGRRRGGQHRRREPESALHRPTAKPPQPSRNSTAETFSRARVSGQKGSLSPVPFKPMNATASNGNAMPFRNARTPNTRRVGWLQYRSFPHTLLVLVDRYAASGPCRRAVARLVIRGGRQRVDPACASAGTLSAQLN